MLTSMRVHMGVYVRAYMCQKPDMILSLAKALDHQALHTPDLTVQLN